MMGEGKLLEEGSPHDLLSNKGPLQELVLSHGEEELTRLQVRLRCMR